MRDNSPHSANLTDVLVGVFRGVVFVALLGRDVFMAIL